MNNLIIMGIKTPNSDMQLCRHISINQVDCSEVLQCNDGTSNKVSNIIIRLIENRKLLLICAFFHIL